MRYLAALLTLILTLLCAATAGAYPTNLNKYGIGTRGGDLLYVTDTEVWIAALNHWHIRALIDCGHGSPTNVYGTKLDQLYDANVTLLPILGWTSGGQWHVPNNQTERNALSQCATDFTNLNNFVAAVNGKTASNVTEIWNEPNGPSSDVTSLSDYWTNAYQPASWGIRSVDSDHNLMVGGLCFGTTGSNGCNDAKNWLIAIRNNGWESGQNVNAYSIHPYGYTNATTFVRESTSSQTVAKARAEFTRAVSSAGRSILCTEFGRRTDVFTQAQQTAYLDSMDDNTLGVGQCSLLSNWTGQDAAATGVFTSGLAGTDGGLKQAYYYWASHNSGQLVGALTP